MPCKASPGSAGFDIYSAEEVTIPVGKRALVDTGFSMAFGGDMYARIAPRSGLAVRGIDVGAGVIDSDYRGPVKVLIINNSQTDFVIQVGDRIAQMIFEAYVRDVSFQMVASLDSTERGTGGFGSTGVRDESNASQKQKEQARMFRIMNDMVELL
jgi:deoxyuridine 5'-triphosphate nucleotidohydrolase